MNETAIGLLVITWIVQGIYNYRFKRAIGDLEEVLIKHITATEAPRG